VRRPFAVSDSSLMRASSSSGVSLSSPQSISLRTMRLTLDFSSRRKSPSSPEVSGPRIPISKIVCTADGG
jgi:hypothetical protein